MAYPKTLESKTISMVDESKRCDYHSGDCIMVANTSVNTLKVTHIDNKCLKYSYIQNQKLLS